MDYLKTLATVVFGVLVADYVLCKKQDIIHNIHSCGYNEGYTNGRTDEFNENQKCECIDE